jgi:predicted O-methyltransferase YrrM
MNKEIQGWFDFNDIYDLAVNKYDNANFLEIGCWLGKSTQYLGNIIKQSKKNIKLTVIDTFQGEFNCNFQKGVVKEHGGSIYKAFLQNMFDSNVLEYMTPLVYDSRDFCKLVPDNYYDFVFIDGAHDYSVISEDLKNWLPKVKNGGILAGHDYFNDHVKRAVHEVLVNVEGRGSSWLYNVNR